MESRAPGAFTQRIVERGLLLERASLICAAATAEKTVAMLALSTTSTRGDTQLSTIGGERSVDASSGFSAFRFASDHRYCFDTPRRQVAFFDRFAVFLPYSSKLETIHVYDFKVGERR